MIFCRPAGFGFRKAPKTTRGSFSGFTILELLVAVAVLAMVGVLLLNIMSQTSQAVRTSSDRVDSFKSARDGFDALTRQLSQATLNTYYDYYDASRTPRTEANSGSFKPDRYGRQSDLHFISGNNLVPNGWQPVTQAVFFQSPMGYTINGNYQGMENLLNACGFFVAFTSDSSERPSTLENSRIADYSRFRLFRISQPAESLTVYKDLGTSKNWYEKPLTDSVGSPAFARANGIYPVADNVIALAVWPKLPPSQEDYNSTVNRLAPSYNYDSRTAWAGGKQPAQMHQLPPLLDVAMVTIDETSANRLLKGVTSSTAAQAALGINLTGMFQVATTTAIEQDIRQLELQLAAKGVKCRIFRATIPLRSSKWSNN